MHHQEYCRIFFLVKSQYEWWMKFYLYNIIMIVIQSPLHTIKLTCRQILGSLIMSLVQITSNVKLEKELISWEFSLSLI